MPGHGGRAPFSPWEPYALDTTELGITDDLYHAERGIARAEALYARAAGAGASLFLTNGSTCGIHVMLQLYAREGDTVLLPRNAHMSAVNACILGGLRPVWIPVTVTEDGYCFVREAAALAAIRNHPEAKAILITRPDYYGGALPLESIAREAHARGMRLVVDEAHGAHLPFWDRLPDAGRQGADAWVQSVHKTLPGLTGCAVLQLKRPEEAAAALRLIRREQTSSPSFLQLLAIDDARAYMEEQGRQRLARVADLAETLRRRLPGTPFRDAHESWRETGLRFDPTRLVLRCGDGYRLQELLQERGLDVEMADSRRAVLILTCMTEPERLRQLEEVLRTLPPIPEGEHPAIWMNELPEQVLTPRQAVMRPTEPVPLEQAAGRVGAVPAGLYPPGIPLVMPGERISPEIVHALESRPERFGTEGDTIECVK